jgi:hypothetical protein
MYAIACQVGGDDDRLDISCLVAVILENGTIEECAIRE